MRVIVRTKDFKTDLKNDEQIANALTNFDEVYYGDCDQTTFFERVATEATDEFVEGFNQTVFTYGETGSGKTFTMIGSTATTTKEGLIPRIVRRLFELCDVRSGKCRLEFSFFQLYNNKIYDLFNKTTEPTSTNSIERLIKRSFGSVDETLTEFKSANEKRTTCKTVGNAASSRSHVIFQIALTVFASEKTFRESKFNLIDLAGNENYEPDSERKIKAESKNISTSLYYLTQLLNEVEKGCGAKDKKKKSIRPETTNWFISSNRI